MAGNSWIVRAKSSIRAKYEAKMSHTIVLIVVVRDCAGGGTYSTFGLFLLASGLPASKTKSLYITYAFSEGWDEQSSS